MDLGILFGFIGLWMVVFWLMMGQGGLEKYVDPEAFILVVGGSILVSVFAFPMPYIKKLPSLLKRLFFYKSKPIGRLIEDLVSYAEIARRDGILSLENTTKDIDDPFIVRGIQMAVDGTDPELIEEILSNEVENLIERHEKNKALWDGMGKYSPALGMCGTLIGLVAMLSKLSDPSKIAGGMAIALVCTLYGTLMSNGVALPLAARLGNRSAEEVLYKTIIIRGVMSIQSGDNPRVVEQKLLAFLPPSARPATEREEAA